MADETPTLVHRHQLVAAIGGLRKHIRGNTRNAITKANSPMADPITGKPLGVELLTPSMTAEKLRSLSRHRKKTIAGLGGHEPKKYAELLFCAAKRTEWTPDMARQWAAEIPKWIGKRYPDSPIIECALHMDESQFHVHALILPRGRAKDGSLVYGMTGTSRSTDAKIQGIEVSNRLTHMEKKAAAKRLLDDCWEYLGKHFGLARGEHGSKQKTKALTDIDRSNRVIAEAEERAAHVDKQAQKERGLTEPFRKRKLAKREAAADEREANLDKREANIAKRDLEQDERETKLKNCEANIVKIGKDWLKRMGPRTGSWLRIEDELERGSVNIDEHNSVKSQNKQRQHRQHQAGKNPPIVR